MSHRAAIGLAAGGALLVAMEFVAGGSWKQWSLAHNVQEQVRQQSMQKPGGSLLAPESAPDSTAAEVHERPEDRYYADLRAQLRWVETRMAGGKMLTPDLESRMLLAKSAAVRAGLSEVGLGFQDVYGIINAETSWVPRTGSSKDGTPNLGVAQFEPATAQALGLRDPHDVVEAVHVAAVHMKEAAQWSRNRIAGLKLTRQQQAEKLREGVSIYYNLSSRGRAEWNGRNTDKLPIETNRHIQNARLGAKEAASLDAQLQAVAKMQRAGPSILTAAAAP
jgi:hypothetical protein